MTNTNTIMIKVLAIFGGVAVFTAGISAYTSSKVSAVEDTEHQRVMVGKVEVPASVESTTEERASKKRINAPLIYKSDEIISVSENDFHCLAKNIYHEAGVEDRAGKIAVAQVTLNRLKAKRWGNSICDVVYAKAQFSWTLDKKQRWTQPKGKLWEESVEVAKEFVSKGKRVRGLESSHFYHADYIKAPRWTKDMTKVVQIGQHIFYNA